MHYMHALLSIHKIHISVILNMGSDTWLESLQVNEEATKFAKETRNRIAAVLKNEVKKWLDTNGGNLTNGQALPDNVDDHILFRDCFKAGAFRSCMVLEGHRQIKH